MQMPYVVFYFQGLHKQKYGGTQGDALRNSRAKARNAQCCKGITAAADRKPGVSVGNIWG